MSKMTYQPPKCEEIGNFEAITQGGSAPGELDADFPAGTPFGDLTFS